MGKKFEALTKQEQAVVARYVADQYDRLVFQSMRTASGLEAQADPAGWQERFREAIASDPLRLQSIMAGTQKGFTLIELSIVLVVIGLIVGGVLVDQDLIRAVAVRAHHVPRAAAATASNGRNVGGIHVFLHRSQD